MICRLCDRHIEYRRIGELNDGTPVLRWCHELTYPERPTFHCPTGGDGRFGNPSVRHEEQP